MHPVTTGISKIYTFNGARPEQRPAMVPLAWDPEGDLTLAVRDEGSGRIAMWGDEWIIFDSQWGSGSQQVGLFWLNLLKWLSPPNQCQVPIPIIL
jgi:hypothetical protein